MKKEIITGISCGVGSLLLVILLEQERWFRMDSPLPGYNADRYAVFLGIALSIGVGILFIRSNISQFHQRLSISVGIVSFIALWFLTSSIFVTITILFPAICVALFAWVNSARSSNE